mgnify:CR=1 FL=1
MRTGSSAPGSRCGTTSAPERDTPFSTTRTKSPGRSAASALGSSARSSTEPRRSAAYDRLVTVDAVIFDWGGTLTPWHTVDLVEQWRVYASVLTPEDVDEVALALFAADLDVATSGIESILADNFCESVE